MNKAEEEKLSLLIKQELISAKIYSRPLHTVAELADMIKDRILTRYAVEYRCEETNDIQR